MWPYAFCPPADVFWPLTIKKLFSLPITTGKVTVFSNTKIQLSLNRSLRDHTGIDMNDRTPLEVIQDAGYTQAHKLLNFPTMILEESIHTLSECAGILELEELSTTYFAKYPARTRIDEKTLREWQIKLPYLKLNAPNVLTYSPTVRSWGGFIASCIIPRPSGRLGIK